MTELRKNYISAFDSASIDAFARWRVSNPYTIFDSKQLFDNLPLLWDDSEVSGSGTGSTHDPNEAASTLSVGATTAGKRVRQTFRRFNYQPGKSQQILCTLGEFDTATGITKQVGYFDDNNGLFLESNEGIVSVVRRTYVTGSAVDTKVAQSSWNVDPMDGTGPSGITVDWTKTQIFMIDFEWLGVGRVRYSLVIDGLICPIHQLLNANSLATVYMSTPNLPLRYSIENDGNGAADDFMHICSSVASEGGIDKLGVVRCESTGGTHVDANTADTIYAVIGVRLKSAYIGTDVDFQQVSMISETSDDFEWLLLLNPTVAGTFTYSDVTNSAVQTAKGATANTVSGGTLLAGGFASVDTRTAQADLQTALKLGAAIDNTVDEVVLCVRPLSANADIQASLGWREAL